MAGVVGATTAEKGAKHQSLLVYVFLRQVKGEQEAAALKAALVDRGEMVMGLSGMAGKGLDGDAVTTLFAGGNPLNGKQLVEPSETVATEIGFFPSFRTQANFGKSETNRQRLRDAHDLAVAKVLDPDRFYTIGSVDLPVDLIDDGVVVSIDQLLVAAFEDEGTVDKNDNQQIGTHVVIFRPARCEGGVGPFKPSFGAQVRLANAYEHYLINALHLSKPAVAEELTAPAEEAVEQTVEVGF